jgi:uncharacterized membrane protein
MNEKIKSYINRYIIFIIVIELYQFGVGKLNDFLINPEKNYYATLLNYSWIISWSWILGNIIMPILIYIDMKKNKKINWWILLITLINIEFGAIISLFYFYINSKDDK